VINCHPQEVEATAAFIASLVVAYTLHTSYVHMLIVVLRIVALICIFIAGASVIHRLTYPSSTGLDKHRYFRRFELLDEK
jgi:hypothetical protein